MLGVVVGSQSLRRRQNGGQGAAKAFSAVEMGLKMAQMAHSRVKMGLYWPKMVPQWVST